MSEKTENRNHVNAVSSQTTAQSLGALLKSARDIMRKVKGQREDEAKLAAKKFKPAVEAPYR